MKNLAEKETSQKRMAKIFLIIGFLGVAACITPWPLKIAVADGGGALVIFGAIFALIGLLSSRSLFNRARLLRKMTSGEGILGRWTYDSPQDMEKREEFGEVVISETGVYAGGEFYTFDAFSCRLEKISMSDGQSPEICFVLSVPHKNGRHRKEVKVPVPPAVRSQAANIVIQLSKARSAASI